MTTDFIAQGHNVLLVNRDERVANCASIAYADLIADLLNRYAGVVRVGDEVATVYKKDVE